MLVPGDLITPYGFTPIEMYNLDGKVIGALYPSDFAVVIRREREVLSSATRLEVLTSKSIRGFVLPFDVIRIK